MRLLPLMYLEHLTDSELLQYECSDKLWLPRRDFEHWITASEVGVATILRLTNGVDQTAVGLAHMPHNNEHEPDALYAPQWICALLDCDENVTLTRFQPSLCTGLTIQPHTSDHIRAKDPQEFLRNAFEHYTCITEGLSLPLWVTHDETHVGYVFHVTITCAKPAMGVLEPLCIRNCEVELELMPPLDLPIPPPPVSEPVIEPVAPPVQDSPGYVLGGTRDVTKTQRELAAAAARKRLQFLVDK